MMAPPKGNKFGVGYGRPPKEGFSDDEVIALGEELLLWLKSCDADKKCDVVHLSEWYSEIKQIPPSYWKESLAKRPCFSTYYERALLWMGKRLLKNKKLPTSYGNRFLSIYFKEIDDQEFEVEKRKIDYLVEKKQNTTYDENAVAQFSELMKQFSFLQSDRSISDISNSAESKSE